MAGHFNVPFGRSGRQLCCLAHVKTVAKAFVNAVLFTSDFESVIAKSREGDAVYVDPPYTGKGENNGFIRYNEKLFSWHDQERLARACRSAKRRGAFIAVSGLHHSEVLGLYSGWWKLVLPRYSGVSRDTSARKHIAEVLIYSRHPSKLPAAWSDQLRQIPN
jgi:DNA adenine methylase